MYVFPWRWSTFLKSAKIKKEEGGERYKVDEFLEKVKVDSFVDNFESHCISLAFHESAKNKKGEEEKDIRLMSF